jgi:hypothetical protein
MSAPQPEPDPLAGLKQPRFAGLSREPIRMRESNTTFSGWRLSITSANGPGSIELVEASSGATIYRGTGVFLGWSQARLGAAHARLRPAPPDAQPDSGQWG